MKRMFNCFIILIFTTLISGLAGCANSQKCSPCTTEPAVASTQSCVESEACEEIIDIPAEECRSPMDRQTDRMVHNAELADMVVTDIHFLPHRDGLNATGTQRLNHLAWLVEKYDGTIKMDMKNSKSELTQARVKTVEAYLKTWGLPESKIKVQVGLSENEGMDAKEGIQIHNDSRAKKDDAGGIK